MKEINEEIKLTMNLMQEYVDEGAYNELQSHLCSLLEMKRNELQKRLTERSWAESTKPLTTAELLEGGWWCDDVSAACEMAFKSCGLDVVNAGWGGIGGHIGDCCTLGHSKHVSRAWIKSIVSGEKQIHRIGNDFYWSEK